MASTRPFLALVGVFLAVLTITQSEGGPSAPAPATPHYEPPPEWTRFTVRAGSGAQLQRLAEAFTSFSAAGLDLPELEITIFDSPDSCGGAKGWFNPNTTPWRISICTTEVEVIVEHELAHAWIEANVIQEQRDAFLELRGLENWQSREVPWNQRGIEWAAVVVQQVLAGLPLPPALSDEHRSRLEAFELLTGQPAPVLIEWITAQDHSCEHRPTPQSRLIADATGRSCDGRGVSILLSDDQSQALQLGISPAGGSTH